MQEEDKKVTIGLAVAAGLAGLAGALAVFAFLAKAAPGAPPEPPPGLANLYGLITDAETGAPIAGVYGTVYQDYDTKTKQYDFTTNASGYYLIKNMLVEVDVTKMVVYANGYQDYTNEDIPIGEGNNEMSFTMETK